MFIRRAKYDQLVEALKYAKLQLEYVDGCITYWDKSKINKSVTQEAIKKANVALDSLGEKK